MFVIQGKGKGFQKAIQKPITHKGLAVQKQLQGVQSATGNFSTTMIAKIESEVR